MESFFALDRADNKSDRYCVSVATWNIAAVNNNPFEYWVTYPDASYNRFMQDVEQMMSSPAEDFTVDTAFSDSMFRELLRELEACCFSGLKDLEFLWEHDYRRRNAVQGFLKDKSIGEKRLTSIPDRLTNTINLCDGNKITRPTVINSYDEKQLTSTAAWWVEWKKFMFKKQVQVFKPNTDEKSAPQIVYSLIQPIRRSKYPAITPDEEALGVPLLLLCLAILDSIFIQIANRVAPDAWETIRSNLCTAMIKNKKLRVCSILAQSYCDRDVIFLQEAGAALIPRAREDAALSRKYAVLIPDRLDSRRDQNSLILVDARRFDEASGVDVTQHVAALLDGDFLDPGDLFVVSILAAGGGGPRFLLASFHGDSNGLSTLPVLSALHRAHRATFRDHVLLAGLDANTQSHGGDRLHHGVGDFRRGLAARGMVSVWDGGGDPAAAAALATTCSARTSLQPQLNKAVPFHRRFSGATVSLKDWILGYGDQAH